jgi:NSS family neurotransmitter:Na+ symporter
MVDEKKWRRKPAAIFMASLAFVLGIPAALSFGGVDWLSSIPRIGLGFLDLMNILLGNYSLTIGALLISIFVGYKWGIAGVRAEVEEGGNIFFFRKIWTFLIRFICPVAIFAIFVYIVFTKNYF